MKYPLTLLTALLLAALSALSALGAEASAAKPNIVFILVDDAGYGDLGCYGQKMFTTPHIDRLAAEGMKFTRHYAGCTVCAPSRCVLMTGLHTGHCRVRGNGPGFIPDTDLTAPKLLKSAGYTTACIGKYGLGLPLPADDPNKKGFDQISGFQDFLPTAAELAGAPIPAGLDGLSFLPVLLGHDGAQAQHPYLFWNFMEQGGKQSVLQWPWKLIHLNTGIIDQPPKKPAPNKPAEPKPMETQLYNMDIDPAEQTNVAADNPAIVQRLETLMREAWRAP